MQDIMNVVGIIYDREMPLGDSWGQSKDNLLVRLLT